MTDPLTQGDISRIATSFSLSSTGLFRSSQQAHQAMVEDINGVLVAHADNLTRAHRILFLRDLIYDAFYLNVGARRKDESEPSLLENRISSGYRSESFQAIDNANVGAGYFDPGWKIFAIDTTKDLVGVIKEELEIWVDPKEHFQANATPARVGQRVAIKMPKHLINQGVYVAVSNMGPAQSVTQPSHERLVNLYLNFMADAAPSIVQYWTQTLNTLEIPFSLSIVDAPRDYHRCDPGTLTIRKKDWSILPKLIVQYGTQFASTIRPETPILTKHLQPGVSASEVPTEKFFAHDDFHLNRCYIIAQALFFSWESETLDAKRSILLEQYLREAGLNPQTPYLNPKTKDYFHL